MRSSCASKYYWSYYRFRINNYRPGESVFWFCCICGFSSFICMCGADLKRQQFQMAQSRRSSRCSRGDHYETKLRSFQAIVAYNPLLIEEEAERLFKDLVQRMLTDFAKAMRDHDMSAEMAAFRMEQHFASAVEEMEIELDRFGCWIESSFINKECIQRAKADLDATKKRRREKARTVLALALKLSESLRNARVDELVKVLELEVDKFRLREIKNTYEYDKTRSLRDKFKKEYDDHLEKVEHKYEKTCAELDRKYCM